MEVVLLRRIERDKSIWREKARVSLARSLYSDLHIYLFDDPLSALDAIVGENVFINCFMDYLRGHIRILVTHSLKIF
jgi:ABC-type transport system involved in cytochrome bd biosynthesis fused ATPase/permease subunit